MIIDIRTLAFVLGLINFLHVFCIAYYFLTNKTYRGTGCWLLWSLTSAIGFAFILLRETVPAPVVPATIMIANSLLLAGQLFLYFGILRFQEAKENRRVALSFYAAFLLGTFFLIYVHRNEEVRVSLLYLSISMVSLWTVLSVVLHKRPSFGASVLFLLPPLLIQGLFFAYRTLIAFYGVPVTGVFVPTQLQIATFLVTLVVNYLLLFGLIFMANQRSHLEMQQVKEQFELVFSISPDAAMITRLSDGQMIEWNERFTTLSGFTRSEVVGKTTLSLRLWTNPDDRQRLVAELQKKGFCENLETEFCRKDGTRFHGLASSRILQIKGCPHILSIVRDITDLKLSERALRQSEEKFRLIVENSHDIIYLLTVDGCLSFVSPAWTKLLGHPVDRVVGKSYQAYVHPQDFPACLHFLRGVIESGQPQTGVEYRVQHLDGTWYWHTSSAVPFRDPQGEIFGFYGIARDITERKKKEEELKETVARFQKAMEEIRTLRGILPICASCKKIRDDQGYWEHVEGYLTKHTDAQFSHGICPDCIARLYPDLV